MTLTFLEKLEYGTSVTCSAIVLVFSFTAYRRTRLLPFALWIVASSISIVLMTGWYSHLHSIPASRADYETYMTLYRIGFFTNNILATIGSVMLIQHFLARCGSKMPPNTSLEPTATAPSASDEPGNPKTGDESTSASSGRGSA